ncbi:hypothetical protein HX109_07895 [Galbibacter sp. BG1]|uniref:hypothetical protein n=1 Tax=Galbibacter sp. BG1 TaxID=1170699 RepID=UPI0015B93EA1|nr:hypothetical protein [Galbibacter sp. BG1]QLE01491.1 hypothetical protein HX109_07895 [Galbibacter sp. BG1]
MKTKKRKPLKTLQELKELVANTKGRLGKTDQFWDGEPLQKAEIRMCNYYELMLKIESLIKVCAFTLDGEGTYFTSSLFSQYTDANTKDRNATVCIVLELILTMLPKSEMVCYDKILEMLSEVNNDKKDQSKT